jgi:hypothetical protein
MLQESYQELSTGLKNGLVLGWQLGLKSELLWLTERGLVSRVPRLLGALKPVSIQLG